MESEVWWLMLISHVAGIGVLLSLTLFISAFLAWLAFNQLEKQFKRLIKSLEIQDIHDFGKDYQQWKEGKKKEQQND